MVRRRLDRLTRLTQGAALVSMSALAGCNSATVQTGNESVTKEPLATSAAPETSAAVVAPISINATARPTTPDASPSAAASASPSAAASASPSAAASASPSAAPQRSAAPPAKAPVPIYINSPPPLPDKPLLPTRINSPKPVTQ